ncbi:MAG: hypothetical protein IJR34_04955 [Bacteroidales bacterium]|nr:hypothetical protein [Bacteroidales bacterium]
MKKILFILFWAVLLFLGACSRSELEPTTADETTCAEPEEPVEIIGITVGNPWEEDSNAASGDNGTAENGNPDPENPQAEGDGDEGTKISYEYADSKLKQSWEKGDKLLVYGRNTSTAYIFTADQIYANGRAHFTGTKPSASDTKFDIVVLGKKGNTSMRHIQDMKNVCFNELTQTGNNSLAHIESYIWLEGVNTYLDIQFNATWATSHGGSYNVNPIVHFRIKIPTGSGTPKKIGLVSTAAKLIPHYMGGRKVNSIWLNLSGVTPSSNVFDAWMPLPETLAAGTYAVSLLMSNNYYYISPVFSATSALAAGKVHLIQKNMTSYSGYGSQAKLTGFATPMKTDGAFTDWNSLPMLAHPNMETRTLPADPRYKDLYEVRMVGDQGWIFGYMEFKMLGWNYSMPLDIALACGHTGGYWPLNSTNLYDDGQNAFTSTNIDRYLEHNGMTEPGSNCFNNWRADNYNSWDNRLAWYNFSGSAGNNVFGNLTRVYYSADLPHQLTKYYINAVGTFDDSNKIGRLEFRLRRFTLNASGTTVGYGIKLIGQGGDDYSLTGWYCRGLLPQGGKSASGVRQVLPMAQITVPVYSDYEYPFVADE